MSKGSEPVPAVYLQAWFYFPPKVSFEEASAAVAEALKSLDYTAVTAELTDGMLARIRASQDES
jgi:hypothetical protein